MRLAIAAVFVFSMSAQEPRFDVESRLVLVPVTVTDKKGHAIDALLPEDFAVLDNGKPQKAVVDTFATGVAPIALVVAVQASGISDAVIDKVQKIGSMIEPLITGERGCGALVQFAERVEWLQSCTNSADALTRAFWKLHTGEAKSGHMLDAVHESIEHLRKRPNVRRVLLLISESRDRGSKHQLEEAVVEAQTAGVTVYAATYSAIKTAFTSKMKQPDPVPVPQPEGPPRRDPQNPEGRGGGQNDPPLGTAAQRVDLIGTVGEIRRLYTVKTTDTLVNATGGASYPFTRLKALEAAIQKLADELTTQYVLSFTPDAPADGYHKLDVRVTREGDFLVRARPGYWVAKKAAQ